MTDTNAAETLTNARLACRRSAADTDRRERKHTGGNARAAYSARAARRAERQAERQAARAALRGLVR